MNDNLDEFYKEDGIQCIFCRHVCFDLAVNGYRCRARNIKFASSFEVWKPTDCKDWKKQ